MFWLLFGIITFIVAAIFIWKEVWYVEVEGCILMTFAVFVALALIILIGLSISNLIAGEAASYEPLLIETQEIQAFSDNITPNGHFFLGTGTVESKAKYFVIIEKKIGSSVEQYDVENSYIKYTTDTPRVEHYHKVFTNPWVVFFCGDEWCGYDVFYIPEGSIKENYVVDLQ